MRRGMMQSMLLGRGAGAVRSSLLTGLVSFWKLDEASAGSAPVVRNDSHGTNHLSDVNNSPSAAGVNGNAAVSGAGKYLTCASNATLQTGDIEFTVAARVYLTSLIGAFVIVAKGSAADFNSIEFGLTGNTYFSFDLWRSGGVQTLQATSFGAIQINTWYDVIAWVDKALNTVNIEVNGVGNSAAKTKIPIAGNADFALGAYANGAAMMIGRKDDVAFFKRKLTPEERQQWRDGTYPFDGTGHGIAAVGPSYTVASTTIGGQAAEYLIPTAGLSGTLVIYHHGMGEGETAWRADALKATIREALVGEGHILAASNAHGNNWGSQDSINDYVALYNDAVARFTGITKVIFLSQSMGGMSGLCAIEDGTIPVDGWVGIYPACNLAWCYDNGFAASIQSAYGIAGDGSDYAAKTAGHDPVLLAGTGFTVPMRFYASAGDLAIGKAANTDQMSALVEAYASENDVVVCSGNHGDPSHFQPADVVAFINRC